MSTDLAGWLENEEGVVFKFELKPGMNTIETCWRSTAIHVDFQRHVKNMWTEDQLCLWLVCPTDPKLGKAHRKFAVVMTGERFLFEGGMHKVQHIGSATSEAGLVAHVFEVP